nr:MAG TPA: antitoxin [Caudoviricetes sp.]
MNSTITIRVSQEDKEIFKRVSREKGMNLSDWARESLLADIENDIDIKLIEEYESDKKNGLVKYYTADEIERELGI